MTSTTLPPALAGKIVTPADPRYRLLRSTYPTTARPAMVVLPQSAADVAVALRYARDTGLPSRSAAAATACPGAPPTTAAWSSTCPASTRYGCSTAAPGWCGSVPGRGGLKWPGR